MANWRDYGRISEEEMLQRWHEGCKEYDHAVRIERSLWEDEAQHEELLPRLHWHLYQNFKEFSEAHPELGLKDWCVRDGGIEDYGKHQLLRWYSIPLDVAA